MRETLVMVGLLMLTALLRLPHLHDPIADHLHAKQAYTALRARSIARPPFSPLRTSLDLLDQEGQPVELLEEVPIYCSLVAFLQLTWGDDPAWARIVSLAGSLLAVAAFYDLVRQNRGRKSAALAALLLTCAPLFEFYGRAVMPDSWMLAMMLASATLFQRYLTTRFTRYWVGAVACGALAALFKYYGLMVLIVLAEMNLRAGQGRWKRLLNWQFLLLVACILAPVAVWMALVFLPGQNPLNVGWVPGAESRPYLIFQEPSVLLRPAFYAGFWRFLVHDLGPISTVFLGVGLMTLLRRPVPTGFTGLLVAWGVLGTSFYVVLGPKLIDHDYYELMMLPGAVLVATLGLERLYNCFSETLGRGAWGTVLTLVVAIQSPWVLGDHFQTELGKVALAQTLRETVPPESRVATLGPTTGLISVLYESRRPGWTIPAPRLSENWVEQLEKLNAQGAEFAALYFDSRTRPEARASFEPMIQNLPIVTHVREVGRSKLPGFEFVLLRLEKLSLHRLTGRPNHETVLGR